MKPHHGRKTVVLEEPQLAAATQPRRRPDRRRSIADRPPVGASIHWRSRTRNSSAWADADLRPGLHARPRPGTPRRTGCPRRAGSRARRGRRPSRGNGSLMSSTWFGSFVHPSQTSVTSCTSRPSPRCSEKKCGLPEPGNTESSAIEPGGAMVGVVVVTVPEEDRRRVDTTAAVSARTSRTRRVTASRTSSVFSSSPSWMLRILTLASPSTSPAATVSA